MKCYIQILFGEDWELWKYFSDSTFWTRRDRIDYVDIEFWSLRRVQVMKEGNGFHFGYTVLRHTRIPGGDVNWVFRNATWFSGPSSGLRHKYSDMGWNLRKENSKGLRWVENSEDRMARLKGFEGFILMFEKKVGHSFPFLFWNWYTLLPNYDFEHLLLLSCVARLALTF